MTLEQVSGFECVCRARESLVDAEVVGISEPKESIYYWIKNIRFSAGFLSHKEASMMVKIVNDMFGVKLQIELDDTNIKRPYSEKDCEEHLG